MAGIIAPNVVRVVMSYLQAGSICQNVYHVQGTDSWSLEDLETLADAFYEWESTVANAERAGNVALQEIRLTDLTAYDALYYPREVNPPITGTAGVGNLPSNVTLAFQAGTTRRGRGKQGRTFWIGLDEGEVDGNSITVDKATDISLVLNQLIEKVNDTGLGNLCVLHTQLVGTERVFLDTSPVAGYTTSDLTIDSQKNRLPNHKRHKRPATV